MTWHVVVVAGVLASAACGGARSGASLQPLALPLTSLDGELLGLHEHRGEIVVVHLFTIGSMAAQMDVGQLNAAAERAVVIGVALDPPQADRLVRAWGEAAGASYDVVRGGAALAAGDTALGRLIVPTTIVLDRRGRIAFRAGRQLAPNELARAIDRAGRRR